MDNLTRRKLEALRVLASFSYGPSSSEFSRSFGLRINGVGEKIR